LTCCCPYCLKNATGENEVEQKPAFDWTDFEVDPVWSSVSPSNFFRIENSETLSKNLEAFRVSSPTTPAMRSLFIERGLEKFCGGRFKNWAGGDDFGW
jgi:hypothetical protein